MPVEFAETARFRPIEHYELILVEAADDEGRVGCDDPLHPSKGPPQPGHDLALKPGVQVEVELVDEHDARYRA